jgi:hypothetical protein
MSGAVGLRARTTEHLRCGLCHEELEGSAAVSVCPGCGAARHEACLAELGEGSCGTLGCSRATHRAHAPLAPAPRANPRPWWPAAQAVPRCSLCRERLLASTVVYVCPGCDAGWHPGCVVEVGTGSCVTPGCGRSGVERVLEGRVASPRPGESRPGRESRPEPAPRPEAFAAASYPPGLREPLFVKEPLWFKLVLAASCLVLLLSVRAYWLETRQVWHEGMVPENVLWLWRAGMYALAAFAAWCGFKVVGGELEGA